MGTGVNRMSFSSVLWITVIFLLPAGLIAAKAWGEWRGSVNSDTQRPSPTTAGRVGLVLVGLAVAGASAAAITSLLSSADPWDAFFFLGLAALLSCTGVLSLVRPDLGSGVLVIAAVVLPAVVFWTSGILHRGPT